MLPDALRKEWRKRGQDQYDRFGQGWHHGMSSVDRMNFARDHLSYGTSRLPAYSKWPKWNMSRLLIGCHSTLLVAPMSLHVMPARGLWDVWLATKTLLMGRSWAGTS